MTIWNIQAMAKLQTSPENTGEKHSYRGRKLESWEGLLRIKSPLG